MPILAPSAETEKCTSPLNPAIPDREVSQEGVNCRVSDRSSFRRESAKPAWANLAPPPSTTPVSFTWASSYGTITPVASVYDPRLTPVVTLAAEIDWADAVMGGLIPPIFPPQFSAM